VTSQTLRLFSSQPKSQDAFTLLELLIAMSIFSILSLMAYSGLQSIITTKAHTEAVSQRLVKLQQAFMFIGRDIEQATSRSVRDGFGDVQPAMLGGAFGRELLTLTRAGYSNPLQLKRSRLQRVAYRLEDDKLLRLSWRMLDQDFNQQPQSRELLEKVERVDIRYFDRAAQPQLQWPSGFGENDNILLPAAVEITLTLEDMGEVRRLFAVSPGEMIAPK